MDDLELRRRLLSNPHDKSQGLMHAISEHAGNKKFYDDIQELDKQIVHTLNVAIPDGLADRILLKQSFAINEGTMRKRARTQLAIAASFAFMLGLSASLIDWNDFTSTDIGSVALAHVYDEMPFLQGVNESPNLQNINAKLTHFGVSFDQLPPQVNYVNHCSYHGTPAFHMIMQGKMGPINVFVVPESSGLTMINNFADQSLHGVAKSIDHASLVIVGDYNEPLQDTANMLSQHLLQSI